jgi:hypothetical protein
VTSGYLEAIGARLLAGRTFSAGESAAAAPVVVVDERAANQLWPGESALGQILHEDSGFSRSVIGVVAHVRRRLVQDTGAVAFVLATVTDRNLGIVVDAPHASVASLAKSATLDGGSGAATGVSIEPLSRDRLFQRDAGEPTFEEPIVFALGGLTLVLAMVGLYGLANYLVQQRWREFGVRLALGASRSAIWGVVVRMSVAPSMVGVVLGGGLALWLERWLRSVVTGLSPSSIPAIATASALLLTAAVLAAIRPALRAQRADPALVLRAD